MKINISFLKKGSTKDNFMDYIYPKSSRISFWKWQWRTIQKDIEKYYTYE